MVICAFYIATFLYFGVVVKYVGMSRGKRSFKIVSPTQ